MTRVCLPLRWLGDLVSNQDLRPQEPPFYFKLSPNRHSLAVAVWEATHSHGVHARPGPGETTSSDQTPERGFEGPSSNESFRAPWRALTHIQPNVIATTAKYRAVFAMDTSIKNVGNGSRRTPATIVSGSPMKGSQLSRRDHCP